MPNIRAIVGSLRIIRRRSVEVDRPGLAFWAQQGERVAADFGQQVSTKAYAGECADLEARKEIEAGLAGLGDGQVTAADLAHLRKAGRLVARSAELDREIGEAVQS